MISALVYDLCSVEWWLVTDVSGHSICPIFKAKDFHTLGKIPEERRSQLDRGG